MMMRCLKQFLCRFFFHQVHSLFIGFTRFLQDMLDLCHCNHREEFREQEITGEEQTERTEIETDLENRWRIISTPATRKVIAVNGGHNDHETFEPHTNIHDHRHEQGHDEVAPHLLKPEDLWR